MTQITAIRAVGLAVELLHKQSSKKGLSSLVDSEDFLEVEIMCSKGKDDLQILQNRRWKKTQSCTLQLAKKDAGLARKLATLERDYLLDLRANCWYVDRPLGQTLGSADCLCDLCPPPKLPVKGFENCFDFALQEFVLLLAKFWPTLG